MNSLKGIMEKKIISSLNNKFDNLIIDKIVDTYIYPKLPYLDELKIVSKYFKLLFISESFSLYNQFNHLIDEEVENQVYNYKINKGYQIFKNHYYNYKDCTINVIKTFKLNDISDLKVLEKKYLTNSINVLELLKSSVLPSTFYDSGIIINSTKTIITEFYDYFSLYRNSYPSQKVYLEIQDDLDFNINVFLSENNINIIDLSYNEKIEYYRKL